MLTASSLLPQANWRIKSHSIPSVKSFLAAVLPQATKYKLSRMPSAICAIANLLAPARLRMLRDPRYGGEVCEALDREIGQPGKNRGQVVAHWEFQTAAPFHNREDRRHHLGSRLWTADV
jgi:hypothetical protein